MSDPTSKTTDAEPITDAMAEKYTRDDEACMAEFQTTVSRAYDWTSTKRVEPVKPPEPIDRQPHCQATDPGRCDFPDCPCGWP